MEQLERGFSAEVEKGNVYDVYGSAELSGEGTGDGSYGIGGAEPDRSSTSRRRKRRYTADSGLIPGRRAVMLEEALGSDAGLRRTLMFLKSEGHIARDEVEYYGLGVSDLDSLKGLGLAEKSGDGWSYDPVAMKVRENLEDEQVRELLEGEGEYREVR